MSECAVFKDDFDIKKTGYLYRCHSVSSDYLLVDVILKFENWCYKCILPALFKILTREECFKCDLKYEVMELVDF